MQVWPALKNLPMATERAARSMAKSSATITGDLPPSSSVTGTRLSAAARITSRPTAVDPVKIKWSNASAVKARPTETSPCTTSTSSGGNASPIMRASSAPVAGVSSDGLIIARLPAARMSISGPSVRKIG